MGFHYGPEDARSHPKTNVAATTRSRGYRGTYEHLLYLVRAEPSSLEARLETLLKINCPRFGYAERPSSLGRGAKRR